jgi:hypothetical protein
LTKEGIKRGFDRSLTGAQLDFFYMPPMHSEALSDHDLLLEQGHGDNRYAQEHREIIARFGRFPHRNQTLGREITAEESLYLATAPHPSFKLKRPDELLGPLTGAHHRPDHPDHVEDPCDGPLGEGVDFDPAAIQIGDDIRLEVRERQDEIRLKGRGSCRCSP